MLKHTFELQQTLPEMQRALPREKQIFSFIPHGLSSTPAPEQASISNMSFLSAEEGPTWHMKHEVTELGI